jgi:hypothetical protein
MLQSRADSNASMASSDLVNPLHDHPNASSAPVYTHTFAQEEHTEIHYSDNIPHQPASLTRAAAPTIDEDLSSSLQMAAR